MRLAAAAGLALSVLFLVPRLPPSTDMILPRHAGFWLFSAAIAHARLLSDAAIGLLVLVAGVVAYSLWNNRRAFRSIPRARGIAAGLAVLALLEPARYCIAAGLDLIQNAWFMPESMDLREPLATWALCSVVIAVFLRAAAGLASWIARGRPRRAGLGGTAVLLALALGLKVVGVRAYDSAMSSLAEAAHLPQVPRGTRAFVVMTEKDGAPGYEVHQLEIGVPGRSEISPESFRAAARYALSGPSVFRLAALRYLYGGCTMEMDVAGLRAALAAGSALGDPAAGVLLLENLAWSAPGEASAHALSLLSNEEKFRVGPLAAAQLAVGYRHLGDLDKAAYWRDRSGIPAGLLERAESGGALRPGSIRGVIRGARRPVRVGLYAHRDERSSYTLGPGQLVAAADAGRSGRFEFKGLAAGDYFLALALDFENGRAPENIRLRGNRGDIRLSKGRPSIALPALELSY